MRPGLKSSQLITITPINNDGEPAGTKVKAPLMDGYGYSVGSTFTDPQNSDLASAGGTLGNIVRAVSPMVNRAGYSTRIASRSNVFYSGPEPTEISFEMQFREYSSAFHDVVLPVYQLSKLSLGRVKGLDDINQRTANKIREIEESNGSSEEDDDGRTSAFRRELDGFGFIQSPLQCRIKFGNVLKFPRCYVASVGVKFSNINDNQGHPVSADVSVTVKLIRNPVQDELAAYYRGIG